jgi:hypothetical protein
VDVDPISHDTASLHCEIDEEHERGGCGKKPAGDVPSVALQ